MPASCTSCWLTCFSSTENSEAMPGCLPEIDIAGTVGSPDVRPATHRKRAASRSCTTRCWPLCFTVSSRFEISRWCVLGRDLDRRLGGGVSAPPDKHIRMSRLSLRRIAYLTREARYFTEWPPGLPARTRFSVLHNLSPPER